MSKNVDRALERIAEKGFTRIGIMGGTFNPIHRGHIKVCNQALKEFSLDCILFLVSGNPPHKQNDDVVDKELRYEMVCTATKHQPLFFPSRLEMDRDGEIFTINSLQIIKQTLPQARLFYLIGMDTLYSLQSWREYQKVLERTAFICFARDDIDLAQGKEFIENQEGLSAGEYFFSQMKSIHVSSTNIRSRVTQKLPISVLVPDVVEMFIRREELYQHTSQALDFDQAIQLLETKLSQKRLHHTLGVVETAENLAGVYGYCKQSAKWAALLHDCAKEVALPEVLEWNRQGKIALDVEMIQYNRALLHAEVGAYVASELYLMHDSVVLNAITCHTTGKPKMNMLDKILFVADKIEPSRTYAGVETLRELALNEMDKVLLYTMDAAIRYVCKKKLFIAPISVLARNDIWKQLHTKENLEN